MVTWVLRGVAMLWLAAVMTPPISTSAAAQEAELPDGQGKKILQAQCRSCHELTEVTKFRGYYTKDQWRDIVITMVEYGADLKQNEVDTLVDYLTEHLGRK
jgi:mono/diheme cytochrome c family protein